MNRHTSKPVVRKVLPVLVAVVLTLLAGIVALLTTGSATPASANLTAGAVLLQTKELPNTAGEEPDADLDTSFTYQGRLMDGQNPANGQYDFQFRLFDAIFNGNQVSNAYIMPNRSVHDGLISVELNWPVSFYGQARYLEVSVRPAGVGNYVTLTPRQPIDPVPYALSLRPGAVMTNTNTRIQLLGPFAGFYVWENNSTDTGIYSEGGQWAGFFNGNVQVTGVCCGASEGSFGQVNTVMDHPLDPANKYLTQSSVQSAEMLNVYNGNVTLDAKGEAIVTLPDWFTAVNKDYRYQLTPVGAPGPGLYISQKLENNTFGIAGGTPGSEVSWQITGVRTDPYAQSHPLIVEVDKGENRGKYLHPAEHGQPESSGINYRPSPAPDGQP